MGWVVIVCGAGWAIWEMVDQLRVNARARRRAEIDEAVKAAMDARAE